MKVSQPFLEFLKTFDSHQIHDMLVLMLETYFKSLWVMENFVGHGNAIHFATKYNVTKNHLPLFMMFFY
jgi:hypothetical protein